jgi:uncharacterized protein (DUF1501 family)
MITLTRRATLLGLAAVGVGRSSLALASADTDQRFVVVIQRGAMDGLAAVPPYGDPALAGLRAEITPPLPGQPGGTLDLGGFYGLHPALTELHAMYAAGELLPVHAVAGPYRVRSHFEAQDYMESGADHRMTSGWLNRVIAALPKLPGHPDGEAVAVGVGTPLLLRGPAQVAGWAPKGFAVPAPDFYTLVAALSGGDPLLGPAIREGMKERGYAHVALAGDPPERKYDFAALARAAGELLARPDGPRIAALEIDGWDTHVAQVPRLQAVLGQLDAGLAAMKAGLGPAWRQTAVLCMTEFGRTVRVNGTKGTDHGTGSVAFVLGGAVAGGRVLADWPGLSPGRLLENRDLQPTTDLRSVAKGLLKSHLGLSDAALARVFPDSASASATPHLIRA